MWDDPQFRKKFTETLAIGGAGIVLFSITLLILGKLISNDTKRIISAQKTITEKTARKTTTALLEKDKEKASRYFTMLENALPTKDGLIVFPKEVNFLAKKTEVNVGFSFKEESGSNASEARRINFQIVIEGTLPHIHEFIKELENNRFIVSVENVDISQSESVFQGTIRGAVYFKA